MRYAQVEHRGLYVSPLFDTSSNAMDVHCHRVKMESMVTEIITPHAQSLHFHCRPSVQCDCGEGLDKIMHRLTRTMHQSFIVFLPMEYVGCMAEILQPVIFHIA